jgi:hypothetical protein
MVTPRQIIEENTKKRLRVFDSSNDQLFVRALKVFFRWRLWFCMHDLFVFVLLKIRNEIDTTHEPQSKVHQAIDLYYLFWFLILIFFNITLICTYRTWNYVPILMSVSLATLSGYRILDIFAGAASLHLEIPYKTKNPIRALVLSIIAYLQIVLAFSVLYLCLGMLSEDCFNVKTDEFYSGLINALYFSVTTIATVGYGDFSPQKWPCKLTTIAEIFCGIIIIVVILQRVISLTQPEKADRLNQ